MVRNFTQLGDLSGKFNIPVPFLRDEHLVELDIDSRDPNLPDNHKKKGKTDKANLKERIQEFRTIFETSCEIIHNLMQNGL